MQADTIDKTFAGLSFNFPDLKKHLPDDSGKVRSFVNIFPGNNDIRNLQQDEAAVRVDSVISIVPAIAGGVNEELGMKRP